MYNMLIKKSIYVNPTCIFDEVRGAEVRIFLTTFLPSTLTRLWERIAPLIIPLSHSSLPLKIVYLQQFVTNKSQCRYKGLEQAKRTTICSPWESSSAWWFSRLLSNPFQLPKLPIAGQQHEVCVISESNELVGVEQRERQAMKIGITQSRVVAVSCSIILLWSEIWTKELDSYTIDIRNFLYLFSISYLYRPKGHDL